MGAEPAFEEVAVGGDPGQQLTRVGGLQDPHGAVGHALRQIGVEGDELVMQLFNYYALCEQEMHCLTFNAWSQFVEDCRLVSNKSKLCKKADMDRLCARPKQLRPAHPRPTESRHRSYFAHASLLMLRSRARVLARGGG